jgi:hypothetical protein
VIIDHKLKKDEKNVKKKLKYKKTKILKRKIFIFLGFLKAKIDELLRREKEREQRVNHTKTNVPHKPDTIMSMSTDIPPTRRATSASRLRSNQPDDNSTSKFSFIL